MDPAARSVPAESRPAAGRTASPPGGRRWEARRELAESPMAAEAAPVETVRTRAAAAPQAADPADPAKPARRARPGVEEQRAARSRAPLRPRTCAAEAASTCSPARRTAEDAATTASEAPASRDN